MAISQHLKKTAPPPMGEQSKSSNLEFSGVCHCGALSGEVFRFQSMSSTCIIMLVEKQHNLILMK